MTNTRARVARIGSSFFKQKTAYEMRISDWSSDVCSSDLHPARDPRRLSERGARTRGVGPARGQGRGDRKRVVKGKRVSVRVALGGTRMIKNNYSPKHNYIQCHTKHKCSTTNHACKL